MAPWRGILLAAVLALPAGAVAETIGFAVNSDDESEADRLLRIDLETGAFRFVGQLPVVLEDVEGVAFAPDGRLYGVDSATRTLVTINVETGSAQAVSARSGNLGFPPVGVYDFGMTFTCSGKLLLVVEQSRSLYEIDPDSGAARLIGESGGLGDTMTALASYGESTYALAADSGAFYEVDTQAGTATLIGTVDGFEITDGGMAFDAAGTLWAVSSDFSFDPSRIFTIDPQTAEIEAIATTRPGIESLAIGPPAGCGLDGTPVAPEPVPIGGPWATLVLLLALLAVGWRYRHRLTDAPRRTS